MKKKILLLATLLVMQMSSIVHAATMAPVTFTLTSDLPKQDGGSIILLYSGEETDFYVELRPQNDYTFETELPVGTYTLTEAISTIEKDYSYDMSDTIAITEDENSIEVKVSNKDLTDELRQARAKDLTERNMTRAEDKETGLKVGDEISATEDITQNSSKTVVVILVIFVVIIIIGLTILTTIRGIKKKKNEEKDNLTND